MELELEGWLDGGNKFLKSLRQSRKKWESRGIKNSMTGEDGLKGNIYVLGLH